MLAIIQRTFLALAVVNLAAVTAHAQFGGGRPPAPVRIAEVVDTELMPTTSVAGSVISRSDARLSAEQQGRLMSILDVGARVKKGDVIASIDPSALRLRVEELQADISRIEARLSYLQAEYKRQQQLAEMQLTSDTQLDLTRSDQKVSESELRVARSRLQQAQEDLSRSSIRAPFAGVVVERLLQTGERVSIGDVVLRLKDPDSLEVVARPPLEYMAYLAVGDELTVDAGRLGKAAWPVRTMVSLGNEDVHVFELRLDVDAERFASGQTVRVEVPIDYAQQVTAVPRDALVLRSDGLSVFVIDEQMTAHQVAVTAGVGNQNLVGVSGDLQAGQQVVVRGNERLQTGQKVRILGDATVNINPAGVAVR